MIETIIIGIIIGLCISIPLGPIGMLCVQRTLNRGRKFGIATGLGATTSDLIYTFIGLFFISFVVDFLEAWKLTIQIIGSLIMIAFGVFIYRSNPNTHPIPNQRINESILGDYFSSFILTLSNPLILLILIALFARFEFLNEDTTLFHIAIGILSILGGAILWWSTLTLLISKFRDRLSYGGLKMMNRAFGFIIISIGVIGIIYNWITIIQN